MNRYLSIVIMNRVGRPLSIRKDNQRGCYSDDDTGRLHLLRALGRRDFGSIRV